MNKDKLLSSDVGQRILLGICLITFLIIVQLVFGFVCFIINMKNLALCCLIIGRFS